MGILIKEVRVSNFRSLHNISVTLEPVTLLVGANNSGKTSFLRALHLALGIGRRAVSKEDIYIAPGEILPPDRKAIIDILIIPTDGTKRVNNFTSEWEEHFGSLIQPNELEMDFLGIRTIIRYDVLKNDYIIEQHALNNWQVDSTNWENTSLLRNGKISRNTLENIPLFFIDAQRDICEDLRDRASYWGRLVNNLGLSEENVEEIEKELSSINDKIINGSDVLVHLKNELKQLNDVDSNKGKGVEITPLTRKLRDLNKGMDIHFQDGESESFSISYHGMGTRSWATLLTFNANISWMAKKAQEAHNKPFYPILALEEPESHLHPQAQRHIYNQLTRFDGQKIVSTHSPYIVGLADLKTIRHFSKTVTETKVTLIDLNGLEDEDIRKINREVMNTRGELLFSRALVLFEGETEEQALPIFARAFWKTHPYELGICFVGIGGKGKYLPFLRVANGLGLNWFILSDGEKDAVKAVKSALRKIDIETVSLPDNIIIIDSKDNFEKHLIRQGYDQELIMAVEIVDGEGYFKRFIEKHDGDPHSPKKTSDICSTCGQNIYEKSTRDYSDNEGIKQALYDCLDKGKTKYGPVIAETICSLPDKTRLFPPKILELFVSISNSLGLPKAEGGE